MAQKGWKSEQQPWLFGIRFALWSASRDVYRLPVAFRLIRVTTSLEYRMENALFHEMVGHFVPPVWATRSIVEGDAAYGSQDNMRMVMQRDADDPARRWGFVCAMVRTWQYAIKRFSQARRGALGNFSMRFVYASSRIKSSTMGRHG